MTGSTNANQNEQETRSIQLTLRDGATLRYRGWVEDNPNGSITVHDEHGVKTIYLRHEFTEWHFEDARTPVPTR